VGWVTVWAISGGRWAIFATKNIWSHWLVLEPRHCDSGNGNGNNKLGENEIQYWSESWDRCYDFLNVFAEKIAEKVGALDSGQRKIIHKFDPNIEFWKNRQLFRRKLAKIAKNVIITSTPAPMPDK
jgi:hypothetical protein